MNQAQREQLEKLLDDLCNKENLAAVAFTRGNETILDDAVSKQDRIRCSIFAFVESLGDCIEGVLDVTDPRSSLRPIEVKDCGLAYFHAWTHDVEDTPCAIFEYPDGRVQYDLVYNIRFVDVSQEEETARALYELAQSKLETEAT